MGNALQVSPSQTNFSDQTEWVDIHMVGFEGLLARFPLPGIMPHFSGLEKFSDLQEYPIELKNCIYRDHCI